jgi:hypothetical protein
MLTKQSLGCGKKFMGAMEGRHRLGEGELADSGEKIADPADQEQYAW